MNDVIRTSGLRKRYGSTQALDGLDLRVEDGHAQFEVDAEHLEAVIAALAKLDPRSLVAPSTHPRAALVAPLRRRTRTDRRGHIRGTAVTPATDRGGSTLAGTGSLVPFILRRDRIRLAVWVLAIAGLALSTAGSYPDVYSTEAQVSARAELLATNPGSIALFGPGYGLETATLDNLGPLIAVEISVLALALVTLMSLLLVVRHTRGEEQSGRAELVRAGVVGRQATTAAALVVVGATNLVVGATLTLGLASTGLPLQGSLAFGASVTAVGLVFAGLAAVTGPDHGAQPGREWSRGFAARAGLRAARRR